MTLTAPHAGAAGTAAGPRPWAGMTAPRGRRRVSRRRRWFAAHPAWPVTALLAGYPVWWALGLGDLSVVIMAVPMMLRMHAWHRQGRRVRVPPAFGLWLMFLVVVAAGIATLGLTAPGTVVSPLSNRLLAFVIRGLTYLALTVILLYAGNLTERELPRRRLAWLLGLVGIYATIGGVGGILFPAFQFTSPLALVMPKGFQANTLVQSMLHPALSQVQNVLGVAEGRPKAPFNYTNAWGESLTILLPWLLVAWSNTRRQRRMALAVVAVAIVTIVYSLNRGVWVGIAFTACYLAVRFAARGRLALLGAICAGFALAGVIIILSPLHHMIGTRLSSDQNSNTIRTTLSILAVQDAAASPLIGY